MMLGMKNLKPIRKRLGLTQQALGQVIGCTQGNVGYYEHGQAMPTPRSAHWRCVSPLDVASVGVA